MQKQLAEVTDEQLFDAVKSLCDNPELPSRKIAIMYIVWVVALSIKEEEFTNQKTESPCQKTRKR